MAIDILVVDGGKSRAASIPCTRNHAGYPEGIPGIDLLLLMRRQAERFGAVREEAHVDAIRPDGENFLIDVEGRSLAARTVLLATGVVNNRPDMPDDVHAAALARGLLRYCPICDGYEVTDRNVGVIGM